MMSYISFVKLAIAMSVPSGQYLTAKYLPRHHKLSIQNKATYIPLCGCAFNFCQILTPTLTVKNLPTSLTLQLMFDWCVSIEWNFEIMNIRNLGSLGI